MYGPRPVDGISSLRRAIIDKGANLTVADLSSITIQ